MARFLDSGWWPYAIPYFGFLLIVQFGGAVPHLLPLRVLIPLGFLIFFARRGSYAELRDFRIEPLRIALDVLVGVAGAVIWVVPFLVAPALRPGPETAFDANQLGTSLVWLTLTLRLTGFALVTPFMEELFVRSWLQRTVESMGRRDAEFRSLPMATFTIRSFLVVVLWFTLSHARWEWPVAAAWIVITQLWFYHRKHLMPLVISHAASNISVFLFVVFGNERFHDPQGNPVSLWFFL